jgi:hypothetical protein
LVGAPLALVAQPLGRHWLFYLGIVLLAVALVLPAETGQTLKGRARNLVRHLPGASWLGRRAGGESGEQTNTEHRASNTEI